MRRHAIRTLTISLLAIGVGCAEYYSLWGIVVPGWIGLMGLVIYDWHVRRELHRRQRQLQQEHRLQQRLRLQRNYVSLTPAPLLGRQIEALDRDIALLLGPENRQRYSRGQAVTIKGSAGGQYLVSPQKISSNTIQLSPERGVFCAVPRGSRGIAALDRRAAFAAAIFAIICDEEGYRKVAIRQRIP